MSLPMLAVSTFSSFATLLAPGGEMREQTRVSLPEGNQIEIVRGTETQKDNLLAVVECGTENATLITYSMDKPDERLAVNKSVDSQGIAFLPQERGTETVAFTSKHIKPIAEERAAVNLPPESSIAIQQTDRNDATLAVYQEDKQAPMLAVYPSSKDGGIQTVFTSKRTERSLA
jgi:hypothetical protein